MLSFVFTRERLFSDVLPTKTKDILLWNLDLGPNRNGWEGDAIIHWGWKVVYLLSEYIMFYIYLMVYWNRNWCQRCVFRKCVVKNIAHWEWYAWHTIPHVKQIVQYILSFYCKVLLNFSTARKCTITVVDCAFHINYLHATRSKKLAFADDKLLHRARIERESEICVHQQFWESENNGWHVWSGQVGVCIWWEKHIRHRHHWVFWENEKKRSG